MALPRLLRPRSARISGLAAEAVAILRDPSPRSDSPGSDSRSPDPVSRRAHPSPPTRAELGALRSEIRRLTPDADRSGALLSALAGLAHRLIGTDPGPQVFAEVLRLNRAAASPLTPSALARAAEELGLEPVARGPQRFRQAPPPRSAGERTTPLAIRQGRLGDCWLIAALIACEAVSPGFADSLVSAGSAPPGGFGPEPSSTTNGSGLRSVRLFAPAVRLPLVRRAPGLPLRPVEVTITDGLPAGHRAGDALLRPNAASFVEKAAAVLWGSGSYRRMQFDFAGTGFALLTGRWSPARPVPRRVETIAGWLEAGMPVAVSTLVRPGGSFLLPREDDPSRSVALMDGHVYAVLDVRRCDEDLRDDPGAPLRAIVVNPHGEREGEPRRTRLALSSAQLRRAFISANVGPALSQPSASPRARRG